MSAVDKIRTHKMKRNEAKKRKLEAFLELIRQDEANFVPKKKKSGASFQESYKALKDELNRYKKKKSPNPLFALKDGGRGAMVTLKNDDLVCNSPLFSEDLQSLLLTSVLGQISPSPLNWAKFEHAHNASKTVLLEIKGVSQFDTIKLQSKLNENGVVFPYIIEIISSNIPLATKLSMLSKYYYLNKENYSSMFPIDNLIGSKNEESDSGNRISKLHLLLSPIQLAMEHYPLPYSAFAQSKSEGYCFSKEKYSPVHEGSPMFAIDCEMCRTTTGNQEVTRVAIVNENLETVYHTLVKPKNDIIDYCTRYSGITESMLRDVTTTLEKVQNDMRELLPNDAILCGQSLNCDLHVLKMIHPYVIDTSVIFNQWGARHKKISLKQLARIHLKMNIQCGREGHNPIEDSLATMRLVQLKLKNCLEYGDAVISGIATADETRTRKQNVVFDNIFFSVLRKFSKKVSLIGSEESLRNYRPGVIKDNVSQVTKLEIIENMKAITENLANNHLILSHLDLDSNKCAIEQVNDGVKQLYNSFPADTLFVIYISDVQTVQQGNMKKNYCMVTLKSENTASVWNLNNI